MLIMSSFGRKLWSVIKSFGVTFAGVIVATDAVAVVAKVDGLSMQPTFNEEDEGSDYVLLSRWSARKYDFQRGQIVSLISPREPNVLIIKRIVALEGDTVIARPRYKHRTVIVPKGHCWVEGDNADKSFDSNTFGCVPLGLISAVSLFIIWPPNRWKRLEISLPTDRTVLFHNNKCLVTFDSKNLIDFQTLHNFDDSFTLVEQN